MKPFALSLSKGEREIRWNELFFAATRHTREPIAL